MRKLKLSREGRLLIASWVGSVFGVEEIGLIQLRGEPYQRIVSYRGVEEVADCNVTLNRLAYSGRYKQKVGEKVVMVETLLSDLFENSGYYCLHEKIEAGKNLSFVESFGLMTFVCTALNKPLYEVIVPRMKVVGSQETHLLQATGLLFSMSTKESYVGLTPEEVAGMTAAVISLDTVARPKYSGKVLAFGGMGGDLGYPENGKNSKLFSLSTLSAIALSVDGPVHKHHSYPNTSKVAGQSAIEAYGARSDFDSEKAMEQVLGETGLLMTSCHNTRTLHSLSHLLKGETVNHVVGPLAFTVSADTPLQAMIGVNEKIHPGIIAEALLILNNLGFQRYEESVVYCGTDLIGTSPHIAADKSYLKQHIRLDEVAPPPYDTVAAFLSGGENKGTYIISPEDFYPDEDLREINPLELFIPNTKESILKGNIRALVSHDLSKARYLAMTVGLGLFVRYCLHLPEALDTKEGRVNRDMLRACTKRGYEILASGKAFNQLRVYTEVTQKYAGGRL